MFISQAVFQKHPLLGKMLSEMGRVLDSLEAVNIGRLVQRARRLDQTSLALERTSQELFPHPVRTRSISHSPV
ncbi:hypothetical protein N7494_000789 [Penicillium frequentans]|uniref:Uncharacterized protein n=1 Tax=Penicillium frequentans TaxID=3151616 RepID=A0AAD6D6W2_9EURO|nr:hypothetical protein N7494_000789 [Penicillium glabrum]